LTVVKLFRSSHYTVTWKKSKYNTLINIINKYKYKYKYKYIYNSLNNMAAAASSRLHITSATRRIQTELSSELVELRV